MRAARPSSILRRVVAMVLAGVVGPSLPAAAAADEPARDDVVSAPAVPPPAPADEPASTEETVGVVLLVSAGVALSAGIGLGIASVIEHRRSRDILQDAVRDEEELLASQSAYADAVASRDDLRVASGFAAAAGLGLFVTAGALFAIDEANDDARRPPAPPVALAPAVGPGLGGATATLRF